jgi:hypothetical protein
VEVFFGFDEAESAASAESSTAAVSSGVLAAVVVAALLAVVLVAMFVKTRPKKDQTDLPLANDGMNSMYLTSQSHTSFGSGAATGAAIAKVAEPAVAPAIAAKWGDRLWSEFRRCIAFDRLYFGNKLLALDDAALEDVYAILAVTCPVRRVFGQLRVVGDRFASKKINKNQINDMVLDDIVDFIEKAMPDVLVERAIDMCAQIESAKRNAATAEEDFYEFIDDYVPEQNMYLAPNGSCMGLRPDAADRELHQVDPLYFEPEEVEYDGAAGESTYSDICQYALGRQEAHGADYALGNADGSGYGVVGEEAGHAIYDMGGDTAHGETYDTANLVQEEAYDRANQRSMSDELYDAATDNASFGGEPVYSVGSMADDGTYGMASGSESQVIHPTSVGAPTYDAASPADEPTYGIADDVAPPADEPTYGIAAGGMEMERDNDTYDIAQAEGPVYDSGAMQDGEYDNTPALRREDATLLRDDDVAMNPSEYDLGSDTLTATNPAIYDYGAAGEDATYDGPADYDFGDIGRSRRGSTRSISYHEATQGEEDTSEDGGYMKV